MAKRQMAAFVMVVYEATGEILALRTIPPKIDPWEYPGGRTKVDEALSDEEKKRVLMDAAVRHTEAKTGLTIEILPDVIFDETWGNLPIKGFVGIAKSKEVILTDKHTEAGWFLSPDDIPTEAYEERAALPQDSAEEPAKNPGPPDSMYEEFRKASAVYVAYRKREN
jgi:ADP-ribose pyrophosphatase YjhB (NUDIX family)